MPGDLFKAGKNHLPLPPMDSAGEKSITHFPQWTVPDEFCRAGKNQLPAFPNGQCRVIVAGLGKIIYHCPQLPVLDDFCCAGRFLQGWKIICHILRQPRPIQLSTWNVAHFSAHQLKPWNENRNRIEPRHVKSITEPNRTDILQKK